MWLTQCVYFLGLLKLHTKHWLPTIGTQRQRWSFGFTHLSEVKDLWHTGSWSIFRWQTGHNQCKLLLVKSINKKILFWRQKVGLFHVACSYYDILMTNTFCPVSCFESNENFSLCSNTPFPSFPHPCPVCRALAREKWQCSATVACLLPFVSQSCSRCHYYINFLPTPAFSCSFLLSQPTLNWLFILALEKFSDRTYHFFSDHFLSEKKDDFEGC